MSMETIEIVQNNWRNMKISEHENNHFMVNPEILIWGRQYIESREHT